MIPSLRAALAASPIGAVLIPAALPPALADALREEAAAAPFRDYWLADRGRYRVNDTLSIPDYFSILIEWTRQMTGDTLQTRFARFTRHVRGDYAQPKDDDRLFAALGRPARAVDLTLDLSAASGDEGQVVYFGAAGSLLVPQSPGLLALVLRHAALPPVSRYERYLNQRFTGGELFRLRLVLTADTPAP